MRKRNAMELESYLEGFEAGINCFYGQLSKQDFTGKAYEIDIAFKGAFDELNFIRAVVSIEDERKGSGKREKI